MAPADDDNGNNDDGNDDDENDTTANTVDEIIFRTELPSSPQQPLGLASSQPQVIILITLLILNLKVIDDGNYIAG